jgi:hypothetical protein
MGAQDEIVINLHAIARTTGGTAPICRDVRLSWARQITAP